MMFINSIFLPKNHSEQTPPEGADLKSDNFSHLFSNVFRIIEDSQEESGPIKSEELTSESSSEIHDELLEKSLNSDNSTNLDIQNISMMVSSCFSKIHQEENRINTKDANENGIEKNFPKHFSLNKSEIITDIKQTQNILKSSLQDSSGKVEISLFANDKSTGIDLSIINSNELENGVAQQSTLNKEFEILIKNGNAIVPNTERPSLTENTIKSISSNSVDKNNSENTLSIKNIANNKEVPLRQESEAGIKTESKFKNNEVKQNNGSLILKDNLLNGDHATENLKMLNKTNEKSEVMANYKNVEKTNSSAAEKHYSHEGNALDELIKKTNVKQIDVTVQKITQTNKANIQKIQSQLQADLFINKELLTNKFSSELVNGKEKLNSTNNNNMKLNTEESLANENTKVDLMLRRVDSKIPSLEVITDENNNLNDSKKSIGENKNHKIVDESVKTKSNVDNNVWVKVSLEKTNLDNSKEIKNQLTQQNKITIDKDIDGEFEQKNFSGKESNSNNPKLPGVTSESSQNISQKISEGNQSTKSQLNLVSNIKPEISVENNQVKSAFSAETAKFVSHNAEMIEKIRVISSGEMIREIHKVFESGEKQSIVLRLVPKELGSVKIMLNTINNVLTAKVEVENETVGHIVRNNVDQLKQNLLQSGVNVGSINISYHNSEQKQHGFNNHKRKNSEYQQSTETEDIDETILAKKMGYNTYEYLA